MLAFSPALPGLCGQTERSWCGRVRTSSRASATTRSACSCARSRWASSCMCRRRAIRHSEHSPPAPPTPTPRSSPTPVAMPTLSYGRPSRSVQLHTSTSTVAASADAANNTAVTAPALRPATGRTDQIAGQTLRAAESLTSRSSPPAKSFAPSETRVFDGCEHRRQRLRHFPLPHFEHVEGSCTRNGPTFC